MRHEQQNRRALVNRDDSSGSGRVGLEVRGGEGRQAVPTGRDGSGPSGGVHLGVRGLDQVMHNDQLNYWKVLDEIREAVVEINQTLKHR
jgi:hypothetical protein